MFSMVDQRRRSPPPEPSAPELEPTLPLSSSGEGPVFDVVLEFLAAYCADREEGRPRSLRDYLFAYPGHEEAIAREFLRMERGGDGGAPSLTTLGPTVAVPTMLGPELTGSDSNRYRVVGLELASDTFELHRARDRALDREVAILVDKSECEEGRTRFARWVNAFAGLAHPSLVPVHDRGVHDGGSFCVLDPLTGRPFAEQLRDAVVTRFWKLTTLHRVATAVAYAHDVGWAHGQLEGEAVRVGEFGEVVVGRWFSDALATNPNATADRDVRAIGRLLDDALAAPQPSNSEAGHLESTEVDAELRALASRCQSGRAPHLAEVMASLGQVLEGAEESRRRRRGAEAAREDAARLDARRSDWSRRVGELAAAERAARLEPWRPAHEKAVYWEVDAQLRRAIDEEQRARDEAILALESVLSWDTRDEGTRRELARRYWAVYEQAESSQDSARREFAEARLRALDLREVDAKLEATGTLRVTLDATPTRVGVRPVVEEQRRMRGVGRRSWQSSSPYVWDRLTAGSYEVTIEGEDGLALRAPVKVERGGEANVSWSLHRAAAVGAGFVLVPSGVALVGGDPEARDPLPRRERFVDDFAIQALPITCGEYAEFLEAIAGSERSLVARWPRPEALPETIFHRERSRVRVTRGRERWPVVGVSWHAANAYAAWRSSRDGRRYRLPSDVEWEKACRGVDGRAYPWGSKFDASLCKSATSQPGPPHMDRVGRFTADRSPYAVRDLGGGVMDWCRSWFSRSERQRLIRGGSWRSSELASRCAYRAGAPPDQVFPFVGFRLVHHFD